MSYFGYTFFYTLLVLASVPSVYYQIKSREFGAFPQRKFRLARTCLFTMLVSGFGMYAMLFFHEGRFTDAQSIVIVLSAVAFALPLGTYCEQIMNMSVRIKRRAAR